MPNEPHSNEPNRDQAGADRPSKVRSVRYTVPGMTHRDDERTLTDHLQRIDGVTSITVQSATRTVDVSYDPDRPSEETVRAAIADAGYAVQHDQEDEPVDSKGRDRVNGGARSRTRDRSNDRQRAHDRGRSHDRGGCGCRCCRNAPKNDVRGGSTGRSR